MRAPASFVGASFRSKKNQNISSLHSPFRPQVAEPAGNHRLFFAICACLKSCMPLLCLSLPPPPVLLSSAGSMELISIRLSAAFVSNTQAGRASGNGRARWRALFFLQGGFHTPPSEEAPSCSSPPLPLSFFFFLLSPGREQREYVGLNASGSVWLVRLGNAEETGSLQPT